MATHEELLQIQSEGGTIAGTLISPETKLPGVLFVHGWGGSQQQYLARARKVAGLGCVCLTFDLTGHAGTRSQYETVTRMRNLADVVAAYDTLVRQPEVDRGEARPSRGTLLLSERRPEPVGARGRRAPLPRGREHRPGIPSPWRGPLHDAEGGRPRGRGPALLEHASPQLLSCRRLLAPARQRLSDGTPDAARCAGNQRRTWRILFKISHCFIQPVFERFLTIPHLPMENRNARCLQARRLKPTW